MPNTGKLQSLTRVQVRCGSNCAARQDGQPLRTPTREFENARQPGRADAEKAVVRGRASGGASLAAQQDRRPNMGRVAEMREDWIKDVPHVRNSPMALP